MNEQHISLGFSPCPNDTFMFAALVNQWIDTEGISFEPMLDDIETLNHWAGEEKLDVTKMSFSRSLSLEKNYRLLDAGAALGHGCGPLVISRQQIPAEEIVNRHVVLPGEWTTAHWLFNLFYPETKNKTFLVFHEIENFLLNHPDAVGVIIHENRFTYGQKGLIKLRDLGEAWEQETGLPIPLGGIFTSSRIEKPLHDQISRLIRKSIQFAWAHPEQVMPYVRQYSQEMDDRIMQEHIRLYVNDYSLDLGETGKKAIHEMKNFARN